MPLEYHTFIPPGHQREWRQPLMRVRLYGEQNNRWVEAGNPKNRGHVGNELNAGQIQFLLDHHQGEYLTAGWLHRYNHSHIIRGDVTLDPDGKILHAAVLECIPELNYAVESGRIDRNSLNASHWIPLVFNEPTGDPDAGPWQLSCVHYWRFTPLLNGQAHARHEYYPCCMQSHGIHNDYWVDDEWVLSSRPSLLSCLNEWREPTPTNQQIWRHLSLSAIRSELNRLAPSSIPISLSV